MEKRTYSINMAAVIMSLTHLMPQVQLDETSGTFYCVFPDCSGVKAAIKDYRENLRLEINVHDFLRNIKLIRTMMHLGGERGGKNE